MATNKSYDEASIVRTLDKKRAIKFQVNGNHITIIVDKTSPEIGIRTLGKIDYLCNYEHSHTYSVRFVAPKGQSKGTVRAFARDDEQQYEEKQTKSKRSSLNMASMVKKVTKQTKYK